MKRENELILCEGKYTFYREDHIIKCDRYGEPWRDFCGDNAVYFLFEEVLELEEKLTNARTFIKEIITGNKA